ncbi:MAG: ABC transporter ATP-binding protein, partial [Limnochordia bacterium]
NLTKDYAGFWAVKGLSFAVEAGEIFGFLGPNGAGKTTTINMLTGLARPTSGSITFMEMDLVKNIKKAQGYMGIVPDESNLYPEMNGFDNLCFCAALYGMEKGQRERRAQELLELFGLASAAKRPFQAYSKGMKRKLTIAAGIIHQPKILFLDEPTTGIDVESARHIRHLIGELNASGTTIFLTTHYLEEAERLCHRVGFIVEGQIARLGPMDELMGAKDQKTTVQLIIEGNGAALMEELQGGFSDYAISFIDAETVNISSPGRINLAPLMGFFAEREIPVYEAKILRPSLEEVFLRVTGIELAKRKGAEEEGSR